LVHSIPSWLVWAEIECSLHNALSKRPNIQFKPIQQSTQQVLTAYCSNKYNVDIFFCWLFAQYIHWNSKILAPVAGFAKMI
jgi:hypothetical protein